jgi:nucleotide-binding universal stress UspA family protein
VQRVIKTGDARNEICAAVEELKADLLIMATRGATLLKR